MAQFLYVSLPFPAKSPTISPSSPSKPSILVHSHTTYASNISISATTTKGNFNFAENVVQNAFELQTPPKPEFLFRLYSITEIIDKNEVGTSGSANRLLKNRKVNLEVSPHRAGILNIHSLF